MSAMPTPVAQALREVTSEDSWALIRFHDSEEVLFVGGPLLEASELKDIPLPAGPPESGRRFDHLAAVPFRQIRERGYPAHDDGTALAVMQVRVEHYVPLAQALAALPDVDLAFADRGGFETDEDSYAEVVKHIIDDEIGNGEGANLVIGRNYRARIDDWGDAGALTVLRRLIERERGAYWTYCFFTGDRYLIGASPERHVSMQGNQVLMNPISGTFRLAGVEESERKQKLLEFLADEKEIFELFMVVDEELKMMCDICHEGGQVLGPFLKPMTHLVHTEYVLAGRSHQDPREVLRDTMFAATVTGAPVENACRLIKKYESVGRGYYSGALALFGREADGAPVLDSPILIRTADVSTEGEVKVTAGATLVRDSDPHYEVAETAAKAGGILSAFGLTTAPPVPKTSLGDLASDPDVVAALAQRNERLARFWLTDQAGAAPAPALRGKRVVILHGEDEFVNMMAHIFSVMGMQTSIVRHEDYIEDSFANADVVVIGPGPGDPRDSDNPKIQAFRRAVEHVLERQTPFLAVCLGNQVLCHTLGIELAYKDIVFQGTRQHVELDSGAETVGFYNTFVGRGTDADLPEGVTAYRDASSGDIHSLVGPHYRSIQFHAESILTEDGYRLLHDYMVELLE